MKIPLFPLDLVLFPGAALPLHIFEERYKEMIGECLAAKAAFGVVRAQQEGMAVVGCTADIVRVLHQYPEGELDILCEGRMRFEIEALDNTRSFLQAEVDFFEDEGEPAPRPLREKCAALHFEILDLAGQPRAAPALNLDKPVSFHLAASLPSDMGFKQELLAMRSDAERMAQMLAFYAAVMPKLRRGVRASRAATQNGHVM